MRILLSASALLVSVVVAGCSAATPGEQDAPASPSFDTTPVSFCEHVQQVMASAGTTGTQLSAQTMDELVAQAPAAFPKQQFTRYLNRYNDYLAKPDPAITNSPLVQKVGRKLVKVCS